MTRGKSIRSVLKTIRKQVADAYICHGPVPWQPSHPIPKNIKGTNAEGLIRIEVSPEDMHTVSKYNPVMSRVMNKQTNKIEYYNSKGVYRYEKW